MVLRASGVRGTTFPVKKLLGVKHFWRKKFGVKGIWRRDCGGVKGSCVKGVWCAIFLVRQTGATRGT